MEVINGVNIIIFSSVFGHEKVVLLLFLLLVYLNNIELFICKNHKKNTITLLIFLGSLKLKLKNKIAQIC